MKVSVCLTSLDTVSLKKPASLDTSKRAVKTKNIIVKIATYDILDNVDTSINGSIVNSMITASFLMKTFREVICMM